MATNAASPDLAAGVVAATADALIATDTTGVIRLWNLAAEQLLGYSAAEAIGQTLAILIPETDLPLHLAGFHRAMHTGRTDTAGTPVHAGATHANGTSVEVEMTIAVLPGADGLGPAGAVAALRPAGQRRPLAAYAPPPS